MSNVDDAAVATYPALAAEEKRSFLVRVEHSGPCLQAVGTGIP
jgi:hypothetical protein